MWLDHSAATATSQNVCAVGDPVGQEPRKPDMSFDMTPLEKADALSGPPGYAGSGPGLRPQRTGQGTMRLDGEADWAALVLRVRDHADAQAFSLIFAHFAPRIRAFLRKAGASGAQAEECTQDVMSTLWQKAHLYDPARASVSTWIYTIARNRRIDLLRKSRRPEPEDLPWGPEDEPDQADVFEMQQESLRLVRALADLPENQRILIERAYFGELSHSQIAAETGLPLGTIKSRIRLALDRLRHKMS